MANVVLPSMLLLVTMMIAVFFSKVAGDATVKEQLRPPTLLDLGQSEVTCDKPREHPGYFVNCRAVGTDDFPAPRALCNCVKCALKLTMTCHGDGNWYLDKLGVCETGSPNCKVCNSSAVPDTVRCDVTSKAGYLGEVRTCRCRSNCLSVDLHCDHSGSWAYLEDWEVTAKNKCSDDLSAGCALRNFNSVCTAYSRLYHQKQCQQVTGSTICGKRSYTQDVGVGTNVSLFDSSSYKVMCHAGFKLKTENQDTVKCMNGTLVGKIPECVSEKGMSHSMEVLVITLSTLLTVCVLVIVVGGTVWCVKFGCHASRGGQLGSSSSEPNEYQLRTVEKKQTGKFDPADDEEPEYDDVGC